MRSTGAGAGVAEEVDVGEMRHCAEEWALGERGGGLRGAKEETREEGGRGAREACLTPFRRGAGVAAGRGGSRARSRRGRAEGRLPVAASFIWAGGAGTTQEPAGRVSSLMKLGEGPDNCPDWPIDGLP